MLSLSLCTAQVHQIIMSARLSAYQRGSVVEALDVVDAMVSNPCVAGDRLRSAGFRPSRTARQYHPHSHDLRGKGEQLDDDVAELMSEVKLRRKNLGFEYITDTLILHVMLERAANFMSTGLTPVPGHAAEFYALLELGPIPWTMPQLPQRVRTDLNPMVLKVLGQLSELHRHLLQGYYWLLADDDAPGHSLSVMADQLNLSREATSTAFQDALKAAGEKLCRSAFDGWTTELTANDVQDPVQNDSQSPPPRTNDVSPATTASRPQ